MYKRTFILTITFLLASVSQDTFAFRTTFDLGSFQVNVNAETSEGKTYDTKLGQYLAKNHANTMKKCFDTIKDPITNGFKVVILLSKKGSVLNIALRPETNISKCFSDALISGIFPVPPKDNYWVKINMGIAK